MALTYWKGKDHELGYIWLDYTDSALCNQARQEHALMTANDPARKAEQNKLKDQL